ncbi:hypothetical protein MOB65_20070 [Bacillus inaquosorum]|uniref:hypothetical protein n=1 Tax=Bacillus inaquosorum TaxID=483913 RepID=UPI0022816A8E|nr:hypothetical protein [Bacillus inaquosorum]MCY7911154.1 hypothetical protein [Bacillus inaquosorum]
MTEKKLIFNDKISSIKAGDILKKDSEFYLVSRIPGEYEIETCVTLKDPRILDYGTRERKYALINISTGKSFYEYGYELSHLHDHVRNDSFIHVKSVEIKEY